MGLSTSSPVRRGKTGVIYFRKAVPKDLWTILGRREIKVSLKTCSGAEARRRHAELNGAWEGHFDDLRQGDKVEVPIGFSPLAAPISTPALLRVGAVRPSAGEAVNADRPGIPQWALNPVAIFDLMARERQFAPATVKRHRPIIEAVAKEHPDIRTINSDWCVSWKNQLIAAGLTPSTVQYAYLAALRNLMGFAVSNRYVLTNPLTGLGVKVKATKRNRPERGFTDAEARIVLRATTGSFGDLLPADQKRARRWLPWICNYTGARIGEAAQLRKKDFVKEEGVWVMLIRPEAGSVKNRKTRRVPVHPHLIEQGLIEVVQGLPDGFIFADPTRRRSRSRDEVMHKKTAENLGRWVRSLGLVDTELQPNHGWRHRFKTVARRVGMDPGARDYLQGHAEHNEAEAYGDQPALVLERQIAMMPYFDLAQEP